MGNVSDCACEIKCIDKSLCFSTTFTNGNNFGDNNSLDDLACLKGLFMPPNILLLKEQYLPYFSWPPWRREPQNK